MKLDFSNGPELLHHTHLTQCNFQLYYSTLTHMQNAQNFPLTFSDIFGTFITNFTYV